jgi:hypothetical protein
MPAPHACTPPAQVDLNLLVDYAWPRFCEEGEARALVEAVGGAAELCDLMAALQAGSCCGEGGLYADIAACRAGAVAGMA